MRHKTPLRQLIAQRIDSAEPSELSPEAAALLRDTLPDPDPAPEEAGRAGPVYLRSITAAGWRGVGPEATLDLSHGPGLTVITGANGTGKSSFAEAAEMALTGFNARWDGSNGGKPRTKVWRRGWCNLHEATAPQVAVSLTLDDSAEPVTVRRTWYGAEVEEARTTVIGEDGTELKLDECVNADMLDVYRPFLPYSELGSMVDGTMSDLYRKISTFIGLGRLGEMDVRLADRINGWKDIEERPSPLMTAAVEALTGLNDRRAVDAMAALGGRVPDVDAVRSLLDQDAVADQGDAARLRARSSLTGPDEPEVAGALARLREAIAASEDVRHSDAEHARRLAALLEAAFEQHRRSGSPHCPVCGTEGRLDQAWAEATRAEIERLQAEAAEADAVRRTLSSAKRAVHDLVQPVPELLRTEDSELAELWREWSLCRSLTDPAELAERVGRLAPRLAAACRQSGEEAARQLTDRDTAWRPVAVRLAEWAEAAGKAADAKARRKTADAARKWFRKLTDELRAERMRHFSKQSQEVWTRLCESSNVSLGPVDLTGTAKQGGVKLDVSVDDHEAPAYSVMSQGELHSLALSLFIPRATHEASPFGFLVIDDPVQSMDTQKVEGLATVLSECARHRQVVVFTHDTRLEQAITHLGIEATVHRISREEKSRVTVERTRDPFRQALREARDVSKDPSVPQVVADRVIPAMCRAALEAACVETARRTVRDERGNRLSLAEFEERVPAQARTREYVAFALLGDPSGEAGAAVEHLYPGGEALVRELNRGTHGALATVTERGRLVKRTEELAEAVRRFGRGTVGPQGGAR
ncbi:AAA family ATPase [Streptomyces gougerotii]|uniref:ATP-binding protein n=1 Tax=Streptomyces gougerotii TaxID=53448 RepID=UPI003862D4A6|nr:AAA family ATPase [Streptomyces gougerotii]